MRHHLSLAIASIVLLCSLGMPTASAQWLTETYSLKEGYNAIWLSIDCSDRTMADLLPPNTNIDEVWQWNADASATQFTLSPDKPDQADAQWRVWRRDPAGHPPSNLGALTPNPFTPNHAYLIKVADAAGAVDLSLKGRPVPPRYQLKSSGVNLLGFPSAGELPAATDPTFTNFLRFSPTDPDSDGQDNMFEFIALVDPTDPDSLFCTEIRPVPGEPLERDIVFFPVSPGLRSYTVLSAPDLDPSQFSPISGGAISDVGGVRTQRDTLASPTARRFYRVDITDDP